MSYTHSLVLICPDTHLAAVSAAGAALGYSQVEYSVPLSPTGTGPATHQGLHTWATAATALAWTTAPEVPPLTAAEVAALRAVLIMSARTDMTGAAHFDGVADAHGLRRIVADEADGGGS